MQKLAEICVRRPVFATVIILALVVIGAFSYGKLGVDRFPNVEFPFVIVTTVLPGAAPEEIETEHHGQDRGIGQHHQRHRRADVVLVRERLGGHDQLRPREDRDVAAQEVRDKVNTVLGDLPKDAEPPIVQSFDPGAIPVVTIAVSGPGSQRDISEFVDKNLRRRLETVSASARCS
jgi:HAE1 family hydrophobic/amphiphilic exporter-1